MPPGLRGRVLLVDDNAMHRMLNGALLTERGYAVTYASDGPQAVDLFARSDFELVLLDLQMPGMDGFEAARRMRELERGRPRRTPIVATTSLATLADRERCREVGIDDRVVKPVDPAVLDAIIAARLTGSPPDFELARALERTAGDRALLTSSVTHFLERTPGTLRELRRALLRRDLEGVEGATHAIEGPADELAMPRLRDLAHRIAVLSEQGDFVAAAALTAELEAAFGRGRRAVRSALESA